MPARNYYRTKCISGISSENDLKLKQIVPSTTDLKRIRRIAAKPNSSSVQISRCQGCNGTGCQRCNSCPGSFHGTGHYAEHLKTSELISFQIPSHSILIFKDESLPSIQYSSSMTSVSNAALMQQQLIRGFSAAGFKTSDRFQGVSQSLLTALSRMLCSAEVVAHAGQARCTLTGNPSQQSGNTLNTVDTETWEAQAREEARQWEASSMYGFLQVLLTLKLLILVIFALLDSDRDGRSAQIQRRGNVGMLQ